VRVRLPLSWRRAVVAAGIGFAAETLNRHSGLDPESRVST